MTNTNLNWAVLLLIVLIFLSRQTATTSDSDIDFSTLVDSSVVFNGQNSLVKGSAITTESVRILKLNGGDARGDLGYKSLDGGTVSTSPNEKYRFYFFMNATLPSTSYYVDVQDYTAPVKDSADNIIGQGCAIDSSLIFSVKDEYGNTQTSTSNIQSLSASQSKPMAIRIKVSSDQCYGMPDSKEGTANAVCFIHTLAAIAKIELNTKKIPAPLSVVNADATSSKAITCYQFPVLDDNEVIDLSIYVTAGATEPTFAHNITVMSDDIAFDLNKDNLDEIYGYVDEDGNELGADVITLGTIYIS